MKNSNNFPTGNSDAEMIQRLSFLGLTPMSDKDFEKLIIPLEEFAKMAPSDEEFEKYFSDSRKALFASFGIGLEVD